LALSTSASLQPGTGGGEGEAEAVAYARAAGAESTFAVYAQHWGAFERWGTSLGECVLPATPALVARYLAVRARDGRKVATLALVRASIAKAHARCGYPNPCKHEVVREVWAGIRRTHGVAQQQKAPLGARELRAMIATLDPSGLRGERDRALLLLGFAGGFRRAELAALALADLRFVRQGLEVTIRRSKTDQEGRGRRAEITYGSDLRTCPVRAIESWIARAAITDGPLFRRVLPNGVLGANALAAHTIARIVQRSARAIGLPVDAYGGHSLRAGFVTHALRGGAELAEIMAQTGHRSVVVMQGYQRRAGEWERPASAKLGL
jgi:integrase